MYVTADLVDAFEREVRTCPTQFRDYGGTRRFFGPVRTVACENDNTLVGEALAEPGAGQVLVVDGAGSLASALVGDVLAGLGAKNGWAGVIINGAVRDVVGLAETTLGVKALGSNPARSAKFGAGVRDQAVSFGGLTFTPGDWVYCDEDGVVLARRPLHERGGA